MDPGFFADPHPGFKSPDPSMIYDLNDGFDKVLEPKLEPNSAVGLQFSMNSSRLTHMLPKLLTKT